VDDVLNEGVEALKSIKTTKDKLAEVVSRLETGTNEQLELRATINELSGLLSENARVLTKLEQSHANLMDALQAEWRDTREAIRDRIDNTFTQLQQQISLSQLQLESKIDAAVSKISTTTADQAENVMAEMPRSIFGKRGAKKR
jgi:hypothetical protein